MSNAVVTDHPESSRYELHLDGERVGHADYHRAGGTVTVTHVETDPAHQGKGLGGALMAGLLDDVRARDEKVMPVCPFAKRYLDNHPDEHDLLTTGD